MLFLANENFPVPSIHFLRHLGYDVKSVWEDSPSIDDASVMQLARIEGRIILTFDSDYGELIYREGLTSPAGIIYLRFVPTHPTDAGERLAQLLSSLNFSGMFTVVSDKAVRQRPLPTQD